MFPTRYAALISEPTLPFSYTEAAAEKRNPYHILTERHLQAIWLEQKYFKNLKNQNDEVITVISPGIWNSEAGPDFLKAHVKIGSREWRGDIEIHLSQEGWYQHNHHVDPNYNNVILHVCYWKPPKERPCITANGKEIAPVYLQPCLTISEGRISKLIDLDLYPYTHFTGAGSCSRALFNRLSDEKIASLLRSAAAWRLKGKNERLKAKIDSPLHYLLGGISMVLGYKHNAEAFLTLFNYLVRQKIGEKAIFSLALGLSNFFNAHHKKKWSDSPLYCEMMDAFNLQEKDETAPSIALKLDKIRPANHPVRRLAAMAKMMNDPEIHLLEHKLFVLWNSLWHAGQEKGWKNLKELFLEIIPSYQEDYWECHYTFEKKQQAKPIALIGNDLKREILINVCMPLLYAEIEIRGTDLEKSAFISFFGSFPASKAKKSVYLNYRFFGSKNVKSMFSRADLQQGAYQIHHDFCVHYEASCQGCPFVDRYKKAFG
ncbi:MAG TPA: DUF2851 family protein [Parachlamydiaceae bacterium]|nr:DUF2851 family protein [Parachlamydiaceae bacterium]